VENYTAYPKTSEKMAGNTNFRLRIRTPFHPFGWPLVTASHGTIVVVQNVPVGHAHTITSVTSGWTPFSVTCTKILYYYYSKKKIKRGKNAHAIISVTFGQGLFRSLTVRACDVTPGHVTSSRSTAWIHLNCDLKTSYILLTF